MEKRISFSEKSNCDITPIKETILNLLNKTIDNNPLNKKEFEFIIEIIGIHPYILEEIGFKPDKFYQLMEKNEILATEIFIKLINCSLFESYLSLFIEKTWSVNSLKIINKLIQIIEFPSCFIKLYMIHVIKEYKKQNNLSEKERLSKLFSFFVLNLLNHEHITVDIIPTCINEILDNNYKDPDVLKLKEKIISFRN